MHDNVKPSNSNLIIGRHSKVKIADFGTSRHVSSAGREASTGGTRVHE